MKSKIVMKGKTKNRDIGSLEVKDAIAEYVKFLVNIINKIEFDPFRQLKKPLLKYYPKKGKKNMK